MSRLQKQIYDFPTEKCLEIFWEGLGWCRVTCDTFRAFKGPRRVQGEEYNGPVYYKGTNYLHLGQVKKPRVIQITELNEAIKKQRKKEARQARMAHPKPNTKFLD